MEMETVLTAISTVGFPIAFCCLMFWYMIKQMDAHKQEINELKAVISENTIALTAIKQLIEDKYRDGN